MKAVKLCTILTWSTLLKLEAGALLSDAMPRLCSFLFFSCCFFFLFYCSYCFVFICVSAFLRDILGQRVIQKKKTVRSADYYFKGKRMLTHRGCWHLHLKTFRGMEVMFHSWPNSFLGSVSVGCLHPNDFFLRRKCFYSFHIQPIVPYQTNLDKRYCAH